MPKTKGQEAKSSLDYIKLKLKIGAIGYDEAKKEAEPFLKTLNEEMEKVAKEHGVKHRKVIFTSYMR